MTKFTVPYDFKDDFDDSLSKIVFFKKKKKKGNTN